MTGDPTKHAELRELLINFISQNSHIFGRGWTIGNCSLKDHLAKVAKLGQFGSHTEIKAAASLCQKPVYVATDSLTAGKCTWTVFHPFPLAIVNMHMVNTNFITQPKPWYEIAYTSGCHYDGISPQSRRNPTRKRTVSMFWLHAPAHAQASSASPRMYF